MCFIQNSKCDVRGRGRGWKAKSRKISGGFQSAASFCACVLIFFSLFGCEAKLMLDGVNKELAKSGVRTDQYQKMVSNQGAIIIAGSQGLVLASDNQGASWQRHIVDGRPNFIGLTACPDKSLVAMSFDRRFWKSADNGRTWTSTPITTKQDVMDIHCAPDGSYWVTGSRSTILHSTDAGVTWQESDLGEDAMLTYIKFFDENTGILAGEFGMCYKTTDGGNSWQSVGVIGEELYPLAVYFADESTGWAGGLGGVIVKTTDGGVTWSRQEVEIPAPVYSFFGDGKNLYALADGNSVLAFTNEKWRRLKTPAAPVFLSGGVVLDNRQLLVAGGFGMLMTLPAENAASTH
ncbi:MAG: YCF48-related protein [Pseudomonadota bacterium]